ncbi:MAG TPA: lamin tail domain-containing protein [Candidatus Saccharimonadales bacterium]
MKHIILRFCALATVLVLGLPGVTWAGTPPALPPLLITEVQAGSMASASEEFIELYNTTNVTLDFSAHPWRLELASSSAAAWATPFRTVQLSGTLPPGQRYVAASQFTSGGKSVQYLPAVARTWFSAGIAASAGHVRLLYATNQLLADGTCGLTDTVVDELEWSAPQQDGSAATPSLDGRSPFLTPKNGMGAGTSMQRLIDPGSHLPVDTGVDGTDFAVGTTPSPGADNNMIAAASPPVSTAPQTPLPADGCDPNPPVVPGSGTDDTGNTGDDPPPGDNSGGGDQTPTTPGTNQGLAPPQLTELLPNPASPQTDAQDEFIELYNPNDAPFDLSGYLLEAGTSTVHSYTFPPGSVLAPGSYAAFLPDATGLSLSNGGGQVRLKDPLGEVQSETSVYGAAKDGQAWAFTGAGWQWTITPTPGAANILAAPPAAVVKAAKTTTTAAPKKPAAPKTAKAPKAKTTKAKTKAKKPPAAPTQQLAIAPAAKQSPLHPAILAGIGVIAVLYGAYEYRHDVANYLYRLRSNRAARRKNRPTAEGR